MNEALNINNLQSMKAFIGSHFMFNILNQVQNRFLSGQPQEGVQAISLYNKMIRHAIKCSERGIASNSEEWQFLKNYLTAEQMRFEGGVQYKIEPENNDLGNIPAFIVQPVVEATLHSSLAAGNKVEVNILCQNFGKGSLYRINSNKSIDQIPEKYLDNIARVKDRIRIWNDSNEASISLDVEDGIWIIRMT